MAAVRTHGLAGRTLVRIFTAPAVGSQRVPGVTLTASHPPFAPALLHAAAVPVPTGVHQFTVLAVLCELVVVSAATLIVCHRQLDALLLTASIADSARVHSDAGPSVRMQARTRLALTEVRSRGVHASVLATPVVHLAFINVFTRLAFLLQLHPLGALAVEAADGVTALKLTAPVCLLALILIVLAAGPVEAGWTVTQLGRSFHTLTPIEADPRTADRIKTACLSIELGPARAALIHSVIVLLVHLSVGSVIGCPPLVADAPRLPHAALLPHFDHACEGLDTWLPVAHHRQLFLCTHVRHKRLKIPSISC